MTAHVAHVRVQICIGFQYKRPGDLAFMDAWVAHGVGTSLDGSKEAHVCSVVGSDGGLWCVGSDSDLTVLHVLWNVTPYQRHISQGMTTGRMRLGHLY